jgi:hypothetical protein
MNTTVALLLGLLGIVAAYGVYQGQRVKGRSRREGGEPAVADRYDQSSGGSDGDGGGD